MKKIVPLFIAFCLFFSLAGISVNAESSQPVSQETVYSDNGFYIVKTVYQDESTALQSVNAVKVKSGHATIDAYNSSHELIVSLTVYGTFEYDGKSAEAVSASCSYDMVQSGWRCTSSDAYCSGSTAYATAVFKAFLAPTIDATVTLTCSPTGVLS